MKFAGALTWLFVGLKLTGYINWSWWLVIAPIPVAFITSIFVLVGLVVLAKIK